MRLRLRTDRLAELLAASRLSQNHWALKLGLSRGHWSDIVNGRHPYPSAKTRERMLEVFGLRLEALFVVETDRSDDVEFRRAIAGRYEIMQEVGQGAMGTVFLATDRSLGRLVALKVVSPEAAAGVGTTALLKEVAFIARLQHPNILPLFEAGELAGHPYLVMPYVREGSLRSLLERRGRLSLDDALPLVRGMARGLAFAHERQILHCDVKPENVLVQDGHAFVTDFGIARKLRSEALEWVGLRTELDFSAGTPAYVSPEQAASERALDQRSDIYSLGCVVFEMLCGHAPFGGRTTQEIVSRRFSELPPPLASIVDDVPRGISDAVERAMSRDAALRQESALELYQQLDAGRWMPHPARSPVVSSLAAPVRRLASSSRRPGFRMTGLRSDIRYAARSLRRDWRFALGVILTLALGVGLGVPVLSLADTFFLRPPPGVAQPDRVMRLVLRGSSSTGPYFTQGLTGLDYEQLRKHAQTLDGVAAWLATSESFGRGADARTISTTLASASLFSVLAVRPFLGRFYDASEDVEDAPEPPCVVSYNFWKHALGGEQSAIGRRLRIGELQYTLVGVAPPGFNALEMQTVDAWLPVHVASPEFNGRDPELWTTDHSSWLHVAARLKPGVSIDRATAEAAVLYRTAGPRTRDKHMEGTYVWDPVAPGRSHESDRSAQIALWLAAGGTLLLLLVAANLVNLFVARSAAQGRQTAVRLAIGGRWADLMRIRLAEVLILGTVAALVGVAISVPSQAIARTQLTPGVDWSRPLFDWRVALLAASVAVVIGLLIGVWSTAHAAQVDPAVLLRNAASNQMSGSRRAHAVRRTLLVVQAAVFAVLLTGAGAFVLSLRRMLDIDLGIDPTRILAATIPLSAEMPVPEKFAIMREARDRVAALPSVESASLSYMEPWRNNSMPVITVPGSDAKPRFVLFDIATPEYLRTMGIGMKRGRWITSSDADATPLVVVVNETMAHVYWPHDDALGKCVRVGTDTVPCRTVVGVVHDFHVTGLADDPMQPVFYIPVAQAVTLGRAPRLMFRPRGDIGSAEASVRHALQTLRPNLPAVGVRRLSDNTRWFTAPLRLGAAAFTAFGALAAIVGAVGLYSVLSFLIIEQRRAHAIKLAIGGAPGRLALEVGRYALSTVVAGLVIGFVLLLPLARILQPMLFHTNLFDPITIVGVVVLGAAMSAVAIAAPVRAVMRMDAMGVLREQ